MGTTPDERRDAIRRLWSVGDYPRIAAHFAPAADRVVAETDLAARRVLDAGSGTGNAALAAARSGAEVAAFDLTPSLLALARRRAAAEGLRIEWREGDLLHVPWEDDAFDVTLSVFAAFLTDDPARCLTELIRVTRPGGQLLTTAWSRSSIFLRMMHVAAQHDADIVGVVDAGPFADRNGLRRLSIGAPIEDLAVREHELPLSFASVEAAFAFFEQASGPVQSLAAAFGDRWDAVRADIITDWQSVAASQPDGSVTLPASYVLAHLHLAP